MIIHVALKFSFYPPVHVLTCTCYSTRFGCIVQVDVELRMQACIVYCTDSDIAEVVLRVMCAMKCY